MGRHGGGIEDHARAREGEGRRGEAEGGERPSDPMETDGGLPPLQGYLAAAGGGGDVPGAPLFGPCSAAVQSRAMADPRV